MRLPITPATAFEESIANAPKPSSPSFKRNTCSAAKKSRGRSKYRQFGNHRHMALDLANPNSDQSLYFRDAAGSRRTMASISWKL